MWIICFRESPALEVNDTPSSTCLVPASIAVTAVLVSSWIFLIIWAISFVAVVVLSASFRTSSPPLRSLYPVRRGAGGFYGRIERQQVV